MANVVEYVLSLNDKLSGKLGKIRITNDRQLAVWNKVQEKVSAANKVMNDCGVTVGSLKGRIDALRAEREWIPASNIVAIRKTNQEIQSLEKQMRQLETTGGGIKGAFANAFQSIPFANLLTNPLVLAGTAGAAAIKKGFEREKAQISFEVLLGDKNAGNSLLKQIQDFGGSTPLQTADLQDNAKTMLSFGIAANKIMPNLKAIGDIAMGDQQKMNSLTLAFSQMTSTGKLTGQDLLQMINAGFNPLNEISKKTGKSVAVLKDEMGKGNISANMVRDAFISATSAGGQFHGMLEKLGQSKSGRWSTILDKCTQLLWQLFDIIEPALNPALSAISTVIGYTSKALDLLNKGLGKVAAGFNWWITKIEEGNPWIIAATVLLGALIGGMAAYALKAKAMAAWTGIVTAAKIAWAAAQWALNKAMWASPVTWIVFGVITLIAVITYLYYKLEGWGSLWEGLMGFLKYSFWAFVDFVKLRYGTMIQGLLMGLDKIKLGWYKFKEAVGIGNSEENQAAIAAINADVEKRKKWITDTAASAVDNVKKAKDSLAGIKMSWNSEKSLSDITSGLKAKLGIQPAEVPGMAADGGGAGTGTFGAGSDTSAPDAVATGGTRNTTINITLGSMVEKIVFEGGYESDRDEMQRDLESTLIRVLQMARAAQ